MVQNLNLVLSNNITQKRLKNISNQFNFARHTIKRVSLFFANIFQEHMLREFSPVSIHKNVSYLIHTMNSNDHQCGALLIFFKCIYRGALHEHFSKDLVKTLCIQTCRYQRCFTPKHILRILIFQTNSRSNLIICP